MPSAFTDQKTFTENPFIDLILYNAKILAYNCVVKDENEANLNETEDSFKRADLYISCLENHVALGLFPNIPVEFLRAVGLPEKQIKLYKAFGNEQLYIPRDTPKHSYRKQLVQILRRWYLSIYDEQNEYYRLITGKPPLKDWGIPVRDYEDILPYGFTYDCTFIHELSTEQCKELDMYGVLDVVKREYPDAKYLDYLVCGIDSYTARKKMDLQLLYTPSDANFNLTEEFKRKMSQYRYVILNTIYNSAMGLESEYYHKFVIMYMLIMTMLDMMAEVQSHMARKDILDRRCVACILEMCGIPYYKKIPYKYLERICKAANRLIKYKSSTRGMEEILALFDKESIEIYRYDILKVRKLDNYGNFIYEYSRTLKSQYNDIVEHETREEDWSSPPAEQPIPKDIKWYEKVKKPTHKYNSNIYYDSNLTDDGTIFATKEAISSSSSTTPLPGVTSNYTERYVVYPFDYFREKGNVMVVRLDDYILKEGIDYTIYNYNKIRISNDVINKINPKKITYEFYYDKESIDKEFSADDTHSLQMETREFDNPSTNVFKIDDLPWANYWKDNNDVIVSVQSVWLHPSMYTIDRDKKTITIDPDIDLDDTQVYIIFLYSKDLDTCFSKTAVYATTDGQTKFYVPDPFIFYTLRDNAFFINIGSNYVDKDRYNIVKSTTEDKSYIEFTDGTKVLKGRAVIFNFIYSRHSIIHKPNIQSKNITLTATDSYQTIFPITFPVNNYVGCRYRVYIKFLGWYLDESQYTYTNDKIIILDESLAIQKGEKLEVICIYENHDRTKKEYGYTKVVADSRTATKDHQKKFNIKFPITNYNTSFNFTIIDIEGKYIDPSRYTIDYAKNTVTFNVFADRPWAGQKVNYTFFFTEGTKYVAAIDTEEIAVDPTTQDTFALNFPFFPYLQTKHDFLVIAGNTIVAKDRIHMVDQYTIKIDDFDANVVPGKTITILYIYSTYYTSNTNIGLIVESKDVPVYHEVDDYIPVPYPFPDYIENGWDYYVSYGEDQRTWMHDDDYDIFDETFYTNPPSDIKTDKYGKSGDKIEFTFIYLIREPYIYEDIKENYLKTHDLVFCAMKLTDIYQMDYLKDQSNWKDYDPVTLQDGWWDGYQYKLNAHEIIKDDIYNTKFNYARTKYYGSFVVRDIYKYSTEISYFYSMLYDDVLKEKDVEVIIPSLSNTHKINIGYLFLYMFVLTYVYNDMEDIILEEPVDILYASGFNFKASLDDIKEYLRVNHRMRSDFNVFDMIIPKAQIPDLVEFMNIYKTDMKVHDYITSHLIDSEDYREYKVWNDLYKSLMTWKYNLDYFTLSNGSHATTYTEFLKEKDPLLYNSIMYMRNIKDKDNQIDTIVNMIDDIVYILEPVIDNPDLFDTFPGQSALEALKYAMYMINFFKSYKIIFNWTGEWFKNGKDPDSVMQFHDMNENLERNKVFRYLPIVEDMQDVSYVPLTDHENYNENHNRWIREDLIINEKFEPVI